METEKKNQETVSVNKAKLEEMMKRLERLESAASKAELAKYDSANKDETSKVIRLKTINGKVIVSWETMPNNVVEKNENGVWYEKQTIKVKYEDGTEEEMPYVFFARRYQHITGTVVSETKNMQADAKAKQGDWTYTVRTDDGEYVIGSLFVN